jgi:hypothetical protein
MKRLFLFTVAIAVTAIASAQIQFGVKAGLNLANIRVKDDPTSSYSFKPDFHVGVLASVPLMDNLYLQPEVMYSGEGSKAKFDDGNGDSGTGTLGLGFIRVPILVQYRLPMGFFAEIGPELGFLLRLKAKETENGVTTTSTDKSYYKSIDFGAAIGIGYLSSMNIGVDARFNYGLLNIAKSGNLKTETIQIGVFYLFGEGKK